MRAPTLHSDCEPGTVGYDFGLCMSGSGPCTRGKNVFLEVLKQNGDVLKFGPAERN